MKWQLLVVLAVIAFPFQGAQAQSRVGNVMTGAARLETLDSGHATPPLPKPATVTIHDFTARTDHVSLDNSVAGRLRRTRLNLLGSSDDTTPQVLAQHVQVAFAKAMTAELAKHDIASASAAAGRAGSLGPRLVVDGEFLAIDEGNRGKRILVGFGSGASDIRTHVIVSAAGVGRPVIVLEFDLHSASGKMPGVAPSLGAASIAINAAADVSGNGGSTVEADATRMGKLAAKQIEAYMENQTWIAATPLTASGSAVD